MLIAYVYDKNGERKGCLIAKKIIDEEGATMVGFGWAQCHKKDRFDKYKAWKIAAGRAEKCIVNENEEWVGSKILESAPKDIQERAVKLIERSKKYYKDVEWGW